MDKNNSKHFNFITPIIMTGPELSNLEIGNELSDAERSLIESLDLNVFEKETDQENTKALKELLKGTKVKVITSGPDIEPPTTEEKTILEMSDVFSTYIEKGEGWKLQLTEAGKTNAPERIKYIVENPKDNDLAFFVQKLAELVDYQTAKQYTTEQIEAERVKVDKTFGNQTKRALTGLKTWIENNEDYENVQAGAEYQGKYVSRDFVEGLIKNKTDEEKNIALKAYNLKYEDAAIVPKEGYIFIDPYSNNYAVGLEDKTAVDDADEETPAGVKEISPDAKVASESTVEQRIKTRQNEAKLLFSKYPIYKDKVNGPKKMEELIGSVTKELMSRGGMGNDAEFTRELSKQLLRAATTFTYNNTKYNIILDKDNISIFADDEQGYFDTLKAISAQNWKETKGKTLIPTEKDIIATVGSAKIDAKKYPGLAGINFTTKENAIKFIENIDKVIGKYIYSLGKKEAGYDYFTGPGAGFDTISFCLNGNTWVSTLSPSDFFPDDLTEKIENKNLINDTMKKLANYLNSLDCWKGIG